MTVRGRRWLRGAVRETPEEILECAIAKHKALRDREQLAAAKAGTEPPASAKRKPDDAAIRQAQFAEAMTRSVFGRFYFKARPNGSEKKIRKKGK
jgi:hypothetical protein